MPTRRQLALLNVAKAKVGLSEDEWRAALAQVAGVASARDLDRAGFDAVMGLMEHLGFEPATPRGPSYGTRPGFASPAQVQLVRTLWDEWTEGRGTERSLNTWLHRSFGVAHLRFLTAGGARGAITALKTMKARARHAA